MTEAEYRALDAMNWSTLSAGRASMAALKDRIDHPREDKEAWVLGRAVHTLVLEPHEFDARYAVWFGADRRTKAGKEAWADFQANAIGKETLDAGDAAEARLIAESVRANADAMALLRGGHAEVPLVWTDADTGVRCKGRADYLSDLLLPDLKTTRDASPRKFASAAYSYGYFSQLAFYADGAAALDGRQRAVYLIAVETARPYICQVYEVPQASLAVGRAEYKRLLEQYRHARENNQWPGYATGILPLSVPAWAAAAAESAEDAAMDLYEPTGSDPF